MFTHEFQPTWIVRDIFSMKPARPLIYLGFYPPTSGLFADPN